MQNLLTEANLPSYHREIAMNMGMDGAWGAWVNRWTAEENRHGDLLNRYLSLSGRVDMRAVEVTVHHLINRGFDARTDNDPYMGFVYTSFQERATKISHRNVGTLALKAGEETLQRICGLIAGDEARHEKAYKLFMEKVFEVDPAGAVQAFAEMMRRKIVMPAILMRDANEENLFQQFARVAQRIGVYTAADYADIIGDLVRHWKVETISGLSDLAAK